MGETQGPCYLPLREFRPLHFSARYHMVGGPNRWNALGGGSAADSAFRCSLRSERGGL